MENLASTVTGLIQVILGKHTLKKKKKNSVTIKRNWLTCHVYNMEVNSESFYCNVLSAIK